MIRKKLLLLTIVTFALQESALAIANGPADCCPQPLPACCPTPVVKRICKPRVRCPRPLFICRPVCCRPRVRCIVPAPRICRPKPVCCPRIRCCRPKPGCCPQVLPACPALPCVQPICPVVEPTPAPCATGVCPVAQPLSNGLVDRPAYRPVRGEAVVPAIGQVAPEPNAGATAADAPLGDSSADPVAQPAEAYAR